MRCLSPPPPPRCTRGYRWMLRRVRSPHDIRKINCSANFSTNLVHFLIEAANAPAQVAVAATPRSEKDSIPLDKIAYEVLVMLIEGRERLAT